MADEAVVVVCRRFAVADFVRVRGFLWYITFRIASYDGNAGELPPLLKILDIVNVNEFTFLGDGVMFSSNLPLHAYTFLLCVAIQSSVFSRLARRDRNSCPPYHSD